LRLLRSNVSRTLPECKQSVLTAPSARLALRWAAGACVASEAGLGCAPGSGGLTEDGVVETMSWRGSSGTTVAQRTPSWPYFW
jgi:hypothetical protein